MKRLFERISDMIDSALDDDSNITIFERVVGIFMMFAFAVVGLLVGAVLFATVPIWGIPYMIWKKKRGEGDGET